MRHLTVATLVAIFALAGGNVHAQSVDQARTAAAYVAARKANCKKGCSGSTYTRLLTDYRAAKRNCQTRWKITLGPGNEMEKACLKRLRPPKKLASTPTPPPTFNPPTTPTGKPSKCKGVKCPRGHYCSRRNGKCYKRGKNPCKDVNCGAGNICKVVKNDDGERVAQCFCKGEELRFGATCTDTCKKTVFAAYSGDFYQWWTFDVRKPENKDKRLTCPAGSVARQVTDDPRTPVVCVCESAPDSLLAHDMLSKSEVVANKSWIARKGGPACAPLGFFDRMKRGGGGFFPWLLIILLIVIIILLFLRKQHYKKKEAEAHGNAMRWEAKLKRAGLIDEHGNDIKPMVKSDDDGDNSDGDGDSDVVRIPDDDDGNADDDRGS